MGNYPRVNVDLEKFRSNVLEITRRCEEQGIKVAGVIKGYTGIPEVTKEFEIGGATQLASSRMEQLEAAKEAGVTVPLMAIRLPMLSEVEEVIRITDISLNSEIEVIRALNREAKKQGKIHKIVIMADLGDLREGYWNKNELITVALEVEKDLESLELAGVGTNLGCYGSILATEEKLDELVVIAEAIEERIGRELEIISGGATSSIMRILDGDMPKKINHLRIGEGIILSRDAQELYGYDMSFMNLDCFVLEAEVVEVKDKPSHPVGEIGYDAFGKAQVYEDIGVRKKAIVAVGKVDYGDVESIFPRKKGVNILGASSDHTILDIEEAEENIKVGDIIKFDLCYASIVYVTNCPNVKITFA